MTTAIIGPNGAGESTVLDVAHGLLPLWNGSLTFDGADLNGTQSGQRVRMGITLCPQGNRGFGELNVRENLELGGVHLVEPAKYAFFCVFRGQRPDRSDAPTS